MKCCVCNKEQDISKNEVPAKWFGTYVGYNLLKVICSVCIKKAKINWWE